MEALHTYCSLGVSGKECVTPRPLRVTRAEVEEGALHSVSRVFLQQGTRAGNLKSSQNRYALRTGADEKTRRSLNATATKASNL